MECILSGTPDEIATFLKAIGKQIKVGSEKNENDYTTQICQDSIESENIDSIFRIRELRQAANMTQKELAEQMGYKVDSIVSMWESGERKPPSNLLPQLANVLGCTVDELFTKSQ